MKGGVEVTIVTDVRADPLRQKKFPFSVYHRPSLVHFLRLMREHDVFIHFNISLRAVWPLFLVRRPWVVSHHAWYQINRYGERDWRERLKLCLAKYAAANVAVSHAIAQGIGINCHIIPNPYDDALFHTRNELPRDKELIFVGRLVSDKGADLLIQAISILKQRDLTPELTIVGDGPERSCLEQLATNLGLKGQINFTGARSQAEVAEILCEHEILVVPSLWNEPFGVVALEGIASGCMVVGSDGGGLPEAIGPCGLTFPNGDEQALAEQLAVLLGDRALFDQYRAHAETHLAHHRPNAVARRYRDVIAEAVNEF
jgi:glycogen(starch) synthase